MITAAPLAQRQTKYCYAIANILKRLGHATNNQLLIELQKTYPNVSATTVHRATSRMAARGAIAVAPASPDGSMCYDNNLSPHDHFQCTNCGVLRDVNVKEKVIPILESAMDGCHISGQLVVSGICKQCKEVS